MPLNPNRALVFFVPGIMGSTLRRKGPDQYGNPTDEILWGTDGLGNLHFLANQPDALWAPAYPVGVINEIIGGLKVVPVYGSILRFLRSEGQFGLQDGHNFFEFPYDWRQDNIHTARRFADRIRELDPHCNRELYFVAHSMGGLVTRVLLNREPAIAGRTKLFFQIASPVSGAAEAYLSLREQPEMGKMIDRYLLAKHMRRPNRRARLLTAMQSFSSLYQVVPPSSVPILIDPTGARHPAVRSDAWPAHLRAQVQLNADIQEVLDLDPLIDFRYVHAACHRTIAEFAVDQYWAIKGRYHQDDGDGTVMSASACARAHGEFCFEISGALSEHTELCRNAVVRRHITEALNG